MKKFTKYSVLALTALLAAPAVAMDASDVLPTDGDDIVQYREWNNWLIMQNNTDGNCFASRADDVGNVIQMGLTKAGDKAYLGAFTADGRLGGDGAEIIAVVNGNMYSGTAQGVSSGLNEGRTGGYILVNNANFVADLEATDTISFFPDSPMTVTLDTKGARNAVYEVEKCMEAM